MLYQNVINHHNSVLGDFTKYYTRIRKTFALTCVIMENLDQVKPCTPVFPTLDMHCIYST